jgi:hypothetical protein
MFERVKRWGEAAAAATALWALILGFTTAVGGHLPPWATYAWAQSQDQITRQNALQLSELNVIMLSDKVAQIQGALQTNPGDVNLRASLLYWEQQLAVAQAMTMPHSRGNPR